MSDWAVVFLGVIALCAVVQCVFIVVAALSVRQSGEKISQLAGRFDRELKPAIEDLRKGAANLRAISDLGREQALRIEGLLTTTLGNLETSIETARTLVMKPIESLTELSAFWGGLRRGVETYRSTGSKRRSAPPVGRRTEDSDEHMFIG